MKQNHWNGCFITIINRPVCVIRSKNNMRLFHSRQGSGNKWLPRKIKIGFTESLYMGLIIAIVHELISRNNIIVCCLGLFVSAWMSKGLFHIFYLAIFFVLPLAFPPCIGQEEETRTQQSFAALKAICYIVVMGESRPSLELQYLKNLLGDETVSFLERQRLERPKIF